jgi:hypothetical protein
VARRRRAERFYACGALERLRAARSTRTLDNNMTFPHSPEFLYRRQILWGTVVVCLALAVIAPGFDWPIRLALPFFVLFATGAGYAVGWFPLKVQAVLWSQVLPRVVACFCLVTFYFFSTSVALNLLAYPFIADDLALEGITFGQFVAILPAGMGAAAGAYRVFSDHVVV